jgi:hypothetical protein
MISFTKTFISAALVASVMISPVKAQTTKTSFLEAALFFLTGVEPTDDDSVTDREIILRREPLVAYLVDDNPCAVRLRNTRNNTVWQMDFCKLTEYRWMNADPALYGAAYNTGYRWIGKRDAFCVSWKWDKRENYTDPDFAKITTDCGLYNTAWGRVAVDHHIDIGFFVDKYSMPRYRNPSRSQERMVASFKYIVTLLTGKSKPY